MYVLIGQPLGHSYSAQIHRAFHRYAYELHPLPASDLPAYLQSAEWEGMNVTIPYKEQVMPYLASLDPVAARIGAVNTVLRTPHGLVGYNTDYAGFLALADRTGIDFAGKKVLVLGSGGTSHTVRTAVSDRGASSVIVISRTGENTYDNLHLHADADIIVNTTPVGMYPHGDAAPLHLSAFPHLCGVLDVIYNPLRTNLLLEAGERGIPSAGGLYMLVAQAGAACALFTGAPLPREDVESVYRRLRQDSCNLVLAGMPGCGKSTVAAALAKLSGREYVDTDREVERLANCSIPTLFAERGEEYFRTLENRVIAACTETGGRIIAVGGGAVLRPENRAALRRSGAVCFLTRPTAALARRGRPLSQAGDLDALLAARLPAYRAAADFTVANDTTPQAAAARVWEEFHAYLGT